MDQTVAELKARIAELKSREQDDDTRYAINRVYQMLTEAEARERAGSGSQPSYGSRIAGYSRRSSEDYDQSVNLDGQRSY